MQHRFFYIGPRNIILLLQDAFRRAKEAKLTDERLASYDIVPEINEQSRLNKSRFESLLRELWKEKDRAVLFYDVGYNSAQREELTARLDTSGITIYPLARPAPTQEQCNRAALMMMSTPLWTQAYLRQAMSPDDAFFAEYDRIVSEREQLMKTVAHLTSQTNNDSRTISEVVHGIKAKYHPEDLIITDVTERTAKTCRFSDAAVASGALEAIAKLLQMRKEKPEMDLDLEEHFNKYGYHFAPTNTGVTKEQKGDHYEVMHDNITYSTHMHLKKGDFRLYFCLRETVAVIGAIGDHLPTAGYSG